MSSGPFWPITAAHIADLVGGICVGDGNASCASLVTDTRHLTEHGAVFAGIRPLVLIIASFGVRDRIGSAVVAAVFRNTSTAATDHNRGKNKDRL